MKQRGFDLISFLFVVVGVMIVCSLVANAIGFVSGKSTVSFGINGMTEMRCIDGYRFVIGEHGQARQVLDEFGKGAKCQ